MVCLLYVLVLLVGSLEGSSEATTYSLLGYILATALVGPCLDHGSSWLVSQEVPENFPFRVL